MALIFSKVIAHELLFALSQFHPVAILNGCGITGTLLLLLHLHIKLLLIHGESVLTTDQFCEIKRETIGIEQSESLYAIKFCLTLSLEFIHSIIEHADTFIKGTQERVFFFLNNLRDQLLLSLQLGEGITHLSNEGRHKLMQETILLSQERISIAHSTTKDATNDIASLRIRRQLSVSYREADSTKMVSTDTHGHIDIILFFTDFTVLESRILQTCDGLFSLDNRLEDISIIVRVLALQHTHQTLKAHTGIYDVHTQLFKTTVGLTVELHKYKVPDFNHLGIVLIYQLTAALT